jgi:hypothetical protein
MPNCCVFSSMPLIFHSIARRSDGVLNFGSPRKMDPSFEVGIFRRLLDTRHFSNDGDQCTGIYVVKDALIDQKGKHLLQVTTDSQTAVQIA